ncbi:MAG: PDZ domain-containing protein [Planctomycetota bacterium]|jgi:S1-C subfamily serine protease
MKMHRIAPILLVLFTAASAAEDPAPKLRAALVKLQVTTQSWDPTSPWKKRAESVRTGRGFVVEPGVILTKASVVQDPRMIEVSVANSARRYPARLKHIDVRMGLALVEITDESLRASLQPLSIGDPVKLDDEFDIYQLSGDNTLERYTARVVRAAASSTRLTLQVNTTCSSRGDGQVAFKDGKVAGLVMSTSKGQSGTILSVETMRHYLDDFKDGVYQGCPAPGLWIQTLLRDDLRAYFGLADDQHGIAVTRVMSGRTGHGAVLEGDVLLEVDGYDVDDEAKFVHAVHGRLDASYIFQGRRYAGEKMKARILRAGKVIDVEFELRGWPAAEMRVPDRPPGGRPQFLVVGGLVILELTGNIRIVRSSGGVILRRYKERAGWDQPGERKRIVFVDHVLQDPSNKGFERLRHAPIETVNGQAIQVIADVAKALEKPQGDFHVFHFEGVETDFVIRAADLGKINERIAKTYMVTQTRYLQGDPE